MANRIVRFSILAAVLGIIALLVLLAYWHTRARSFSVAYERVQIGDTKDKWLNYLETDRTKLLLVLIRTVNSGEDVARSIGIFPFWKDGKSFLTAMEG